MSGTTIGVPMTDAKAQPSGSRANCQLKAYIEVHGAKIVILGREFRFENVKIKNGLGGFADAHTKRAKYLAMQTRGTVIGRPGAEPWVIMRTCGGSAYLAKFAIHNGKLLELV